MKIDKITIKYERQFDLGTYHSKVLIGEFAAITIEDGDDVAAIRQQVYADLKASVKAQAKPLYTKLLSQHLEIIANLPPEFRAELLELLKEHLNADQTPRAG